MSTPTAKYAPTQEYAEWCQTSANYEPNRDTQNVVKRVQTTHQHRNKQNGAKPAKTTIQYRNTQNCAIQRKIRTISRIRRMVRNICLRISSCVPRGVQLRYTHRPYVETRLP